MSHAHEEDEATHFSNTVSSQLVHANCQVSITALFTVLRLGMHGGHTD